MQELVWFCLYVLASKQVRGLVRQRRQVNEPNLMWDDYEFGREASRMLEEKSDTEK
jgi:hypothetical protein